MEIVRTLQPSGWLCMWGFRDGKPACVGDAIPPDHPRAVEAGVRADLVESISTKATAYNNARDIVVRGAPDNGEPKTIQKTVRVMVDGHAVFEPEVGDDGAPVMIANPAWRLLPSDDPRAVDYVAAQSLIAATSADEATLYGADSSEAVDAAFDAVLAVELAKKLPLVKTARKAELAAIRWSKEVGGTVLNGASVPTDRETQSKLTGAALAATLNPAFTVRWKLPSGFVTFDATQITAVALGVLSFVQACFAREDELSADIDAATDVASVLAVDISAGWPA